MIKSRITDQEHSSNDLQQTEASARMTGGFAHEFNNKLGIVIGYLGFLKKHVEQDARASQWAESAESAAQECAQLVQKLQYLSDCQAGDEPVDINLLMGEETGQG